MKKIILLLLLLPSLNVAAIDDDWVYTTRPGDTLWDISKKYLISVEYWPKIKEYNGIKTPKKLSSGTRLLIPLKWLKQQPTPAIVVNLSGNNSSVKVSVLSVAKPLQVGMKIYIQNKIITGDKSIVVLKFADNSKLLIMENSTVHFNVLTVHGSSGMVDTQMHLEEGRLETNVSPLKTKDSRFKITTPAAAASVRGTQFNVSMDTKTDVMLSEVIEGKVAVSSKGVTQLVAAGYGTRVVKGSPPQTPTQLLIPADLSQLASIFYTSPIEFSWPEIKAAKYYHIKITRGTGLIDILLDNKIQLPKLNWNTTETGAFSIQIRGISDSGNEGLAAVHHFSFINELPEPKLISPENNRTSNKKNIVFQWLGHADVAHFWLQVSTKPNFEIIEIEVNGNQQHYSVPTKLPPGRHYWRVANGYGKQDSGKKNIGKFSEIFQFDIIIHTQ